MRESGKASRRPRGLDRVLKNESMAAEKGRETHVMHSGSCGKIRMTEQSVQGREAGRAESGGGHGMRDGPEPDVGRSQSSESLK